MEPGGGGESGLFVNNFIRSRFTVVGAADYLDDAEKGRRKKPETKSGFFGDVGGIFCVDKYFGGGKQGGGNLWLVSDNSMGLVF